jgi:hypothetical protein
MATLAQRAAALSVSMAFVVVHMSNRQYDKSARFWVRETINGTAGRMLRSSFTAIISALQNQGAKFTPDI